MIGNEPFISIIEKRIAIQKKLKEKYKKQITTVIWDEEEIKELGRNLKQQVLKMMNNRKVLEYRIFFPQLEKR